MKIIGHRGARGLAPENTLASLQKALEHKVDEIEIDIRVSQDGVALLHHNPTIEDASGNRLTISATNYAELKQHKPDLVTLKEALDFIGNKVHLYLEVKSGEPTKPIVAELQKYLAAGHGAKNLSLGSFSQKTLLELDAALPQVEKIVIENWSGISARRRAKQLGTKKLCMNQRWLWSVFIKAMSPHYELYTYTLNNPAKACRWAKYGLAGVVTDYPDRFKKT